MSMQRRLEVERIIIQNIHESRTAVLFFVNPPYFDQKRTVTAEMVLKVKNLEG
jgi:tRNA1(Val) A37 N6-methylase TrmN6